MSADSIKFAVINLYLVKAMRESSAEQHDCMIKINIYAETYNYVRLFILMWDFLYL